MESSSRFVNIFLKFTRYKLIIASQGRGVCKVDHFLKAKHKGKLWCYVDKGSCKDEKKGRSSGMFWSFEACRKGRTVIIRRKTYQWLSIEHNMAHLELRWFVGCCLWRAGCSYDRATTYWSLLLTMPEFNKPIFPLKHCQRHNGPED